MSEGRVCPSVSVMTHGRPPSSRPSVSTSGSIPLNSMESASSSKSYVRPALARLSSHPCCRSPFPLCSGTLLDRVSNYHHRLLTRSNGHLIRRYHERSFNSEHLLASVAGFSSELDTRTWHANIEQHASEGVNKILIGNKSDWTDKLAVTMDHG